MFSHPNEIVWKEYLHIVWKRRWLVLAVTLVVAISTVIVLSTLRPLFTTSVQVLIEKNQLPLGAQMGYFYVDLPNYIENQLQLMQTDDFIKRVAAELRHKPSPKAIAAASNSPDIYSGEPFHALLSNVRTITNFFRGQRDQTGAPETAQGAEVKEDEEADKNGTPHVTEVGGGLRFGFLPKTDIMTISSTRHDPHEAALIANTVAEVFIKDRLARRMASVQEVMEWLQTELKDEQAGLDKSRIELYDFMNQYGILSIDEKRGTKLEEEIKLIDEKVRAAKESTVANELKYQQVARLGASPNLVDTIPEAMTNKVLGELRTQEIQLEQEIIKLSATYGSSHPKIMALERQVRNIRDAKLQETQKIINSTKIQYETAKLQEQSVTQARDRMRNDLEDLNKRTVRYFTLKREVESNEKVYDVILNRLKETSLNEEFSKTPNATIIQRAHVPLAPSSPDVRRGLTLGLTLALALGIGLAILLEFLDNTVTRPQQIEQQFGLTFLGAVPNFNSDSKSKANGETTLTALAESKSSGAEAYRALRTSILLSSADVQPQVILITSPGKSEGKSLTAANLGVVMAQAGGRVLLIDCDLRKPKVHKLFDLDRNEGLSNLLVGKKLEPQNFIQKTSQPNLEIITCGPIPPNPSELLGSKRMRALLESLREDYERIILDSPPIMAATDAAVLSTVVDGTLMVMRAGHTTRQMAERAVRLLLDLNSKISGVVLNQVMLERHGYYFYDYYYYHYGSDYGYGEEEPEKKGGWLKKRRQRKNVASDEIST